MKLVRCFSATVLGLIALASLAHADPDDPNLQFDADGVPVAKPQSNRLSPEELADARKKQAQAESDKNWLLRDYEKQLQNDTGKSGDDQSANLYYQVSSNRDLARLAGLPSLDDGSGDTMPGYRTGESSGTHSAGLRQSASSSASGTDTMGMNFLKPVVTPLGGVDGQSSFLSTLPSAVSPFYAFGSQPQPKPVPPSLDEDPGDIDTPGMIAADKSQNADTLGLALDVLPEESIEHARVHQDTSDELLTLPLPENADQLHQKENQLLDPEAAKAKLPDAPTQPKIIPVYEGDAPVPASKAIESNPPRAPIASPFDILNR